MYQGKTKLVLKYLGFLINEFKMQYKFQSFDNYYGFCGPIDTYSFYNESRCITLHNIVQRGEWGIYLSHRFSENQYSLLEKEICQSDYMHKTHITFNGWLKEVSKAIKEEAHSKNTIFNIPI